MKFLRDMLTEADNKTHSLANWLGASTGSTAIGLTIYDTVMNHVQFDMVKFGAGIAALASGIGALRRMIKDQEQPSQPPAP